MALGTPASLGSKKTDGTVATTITLSTNAAVTAGRKVFVVVTGASGAAATIKLEGGSLTWAKDFEVRLGNFNGAFFSALAPAGLAKETVLTATFSAANEAMYIAAAQNSGVGAVHKTASKNMAGSGKPWEAGEFTTAKANVMILALEIDDAESSTPGTGYTELDDVFATFEVANYTFVFSNKTATGTFIPKGELNKSATVRLGFCIAYEEEEEVRSRRGMVA